MKPREWAILALFVGVTYAISQVSPVAALAFAGFIGLVTIATGGAAGRLTALVGGK